MSFTVTLTKGTLYDVLINRLYECHDTPLQHAHCCPLLPVMFHTHFKVLKSFRTNPPERHPAFQCLPSAASKTNYFSDLFLFRSHVRSMRTVSPQTLLLIGYCLLPFTLLHWFEHTVDWNAFAVFVMIRVVIYVCKAADIFRHIRRKIFGSTRCP